MRLTVLRIRWPALFLAKSSAGRRISLRGRATAAVVMGAAVFFTVQIGLGWAIDTERCPLRDPIYFDKLAKLQRHAAFFAPPGDRPTTLLFIGSSRTLNAVNARVAGVQLSETLGRPVEAFNFGQAGAGPITNAVYLRRLLKEGVIPDFALIEVHPTFLAGQREEQPEQRWLLPIRLRRDEIPVVRSMGFPAADPPVHGPRGYLAPWYEYRFLLLDRYAPFFLMNNQRLNGGHESDEFGFARLQEWSDPEGKPSLLRTALGQYAFYFQGYRPNGIGVNGIRDTLDVCKANGIRPAVILMPESPTWLGWYDAEGLVELNRLMKRLGQEYGVPVFDGRTWVPDELTMDGHHLAGLGADRFTKRLVSEALAPWLGGRVP